MLDRASLPKTRTKTIEFYEMVLMAAASAGADHYRMARRWLGRNDLFFLLTVLCHRPDLNHDWLFDRIREVEEKPNGRLDLWAREHYKSTVITFGLSIQDILASHGDEPEPRYRGREVTIGILSFNNATAADFLGQIKAEFESNEELKELYPDILWRYPRREARRWGVEGGIVVKRKGNPKEATVEASGLTDGQPTGKHYLIRVYDDVVVPESVSTPEQIKKTTAAWELSDNLGTEGGWERYIGTRYHLFDTYSTMMERGIPARIHPCTSDGSEDFSKAVLKSPKALAKKRRKQGPYTFGAQMLLNPTADTAQGFRPEWFDHEQTYERPESDEATTFNRYILVDPAGGKQRKSNDFTSMWVIGAGADEKFYILDGVRDRLTLPERQRALFALHARWKPIGVGYEEYGMQADIEHMKEVMKTKNYRFDITPLGGSMSKANRITRLVPLFEARRIFRPIDGIIRMNHEGRNIDVMQTFIREEYSAFPVCAHDDALDCLSRIVEPELNVTFPIGEPVEDKPKWMLEMEAESGFSDFMTR